MAEKVTICNGTNETGLASPDTAAFPEAYTRSRPRSPFSEPFAGRADLDGPLCAASADDVHARHPRRPSRRFEEGHPF